MLFTSCITSHATLFLQDKLCHHEYHDWIAYVLRLVGSRSRSSGI